MKKLVNTIFPYFDTKALDAARFFFGTANPEVELYSGEMTLSEYLSAEDFDADMAKMAADPATQRWWAVVKPLMLPLPDRAEGEFWSDKEEIYHLN